jgi:peptidoglycan/xylan/chitin deacetylase (PgdA/CDA1 family)
MIYGCGHLTGDYSLKTSFNIPVLLYHNILDYGCDITAVSKTQFEEHLKALKKTGFTTITLTDAYKRYLEGQSVDKLVLIQFDDAYTDTLEIAAPLLKHYGFVASTFIIVDYIGKPNFWDHRVDRKLSHMSISDIKKWLAHGFEIGSHTMSHQNLIKLSRKELHIELVRSKLILEKMFHKRVKFLSYPYGAFNEVVKNYAKKIYDLSFSVSDGGENWLVDPHGINRFQINRKSTVEEIVRLITQ